MKNKLTTVVLITILFISGFLTSCADYTQARRVATAGLAMFSVATTVNVIANVAAEQPMSMEGTAFLAGISFLGLNISIGSLIKASGMVSPDPHYSELEIQRIERREENREERREASEQRCSHNAWLAGTCQR